MLVYLPNWLPTLSCLSFWRQTYLQSSTSCEAQKTVSLFVSLLHACDRAENLCFPSLLFLYTHGATGCFRGSLVPFSTRPPVKGFFLVLSCDLSLYVLYSSRFSIRMFPRFAYPSFSLVYPFLLYFFTPLPVCYASFFFHFRFFLHLQNLHVHPSLC